MPAVINFAPALLYTLLFPVLMLWLNYKYKRQPDMDGITFSWIVGSLVWIVLGLALTYAPTATRPF